MIKVFSEGQDFEYFFSTLENNVLQNHDIYDKVLVCEDSEARTHEDTHIIFKGKYLYIRKDNRIPLESVVKKIKKYLQVIDHCDSEKMVLILLYVFSFSDRMEKSTEKINKFLNWKCSADLNQFVYYNFPNVNQTRLQFGDFTFGSLNCIRLSMLCKKIKTDYYEKYHSDSEQLLSIERKFFTIPILNVFNIVYEFECKYTVDVNESYYAYFEELSKFYFEDFEYKFIEQQNLKHFLIDDYIDYNDLKILSPSKISIFLNISELKNGWIIPNRGQLNLNLPTSESKYPILKDELKRKYTYTGNEGTELHYTIDKYLSFCSKAKKYFENNQMSEALLHYIIALDLIFGEEKSLTNSVSSRVSICIFRALDKSYNDCYKNLTNLYRDRSKYVHCGIFVNVDKVLLVEEICKEILFVFFRLNEYSHDWNRNSWIKKLDLLVAHLNANELPSDTMYKELGII